MTVTRQNFEDAVAAYWDARENQNALSAIRDKVGAGTAGSVRAGKHFASIAALVAKFFLEAGYPPTAIRISGAAALALPGYYRPQKRWDVVVTHGNTLIAAFELKALGAPSFSNNYNNRVEEALGSAADIRRAALEDLYPGEKPWLGYFFIMEDAPKSRCTSSPTRGPSPPSPSGMAAHTRTGSQSSASASWLKDSTTPSATSHLPPQTQFPASP